MTRGRTSSPCGPFAAVLALLGALGAPPPSPGAGPLADGDLEAAFRNPPASRRILQIIHNFPDRPAARERLIRRLVARGFGGVVANVGFSDYLRSDEKWRSFQAGVDAARQEKMIVWLYDEQGYPSGAAGGLTLEDHPEWEARGLLCVVRDTRDGEPLEVKLPEGKVLLLRAYPLREGRGVLSEGLELLGLIGNDRSLRWRRPGRWRLCGFVEARLREGTHATENLYRKRPYPNLLQREPVERFIALTHEAYARRFAPLRDRFEAIFTDEPSLMSVFLKDAPHPALPWAPGLAAAFREAKGYDILPALPALVADFGPEVRRVRCDFWDVVGRELAANYFGRIQDWCRAHRIASTGHLLAEEDLGSHVGFYGNFFSCASRLDVPGIDCLTSEPGKVPWHVAKLLGSVACGNGGQRTMSETSDHAQRYRPAGDRRPPYSVSAQEVLGTLHLLYVAGINTTTSYYSWSDLEDSAVRRINEHVGRLGVLLTGAKHVCDIALLYPVESAWAHFVPQRVRAAVPDVVRIDAVYRAACYSLFHAQRDFDVIDSAALAAARWTAGALVAGRERYRALVLPRADVLPAAALRRAAEVARGGGAVIAIGEIPVNTPDAFPSAEARATAEEIFGPDALSAERDRKRAIIRRHGSGGAGIYLSADSAWLLPWALERVLEPDFSAAEGSPLRYSRWRLRGKDVYFVINDSPAPRAESVALRGEGPAERWEPATGSISPLAPEAGERWPLELPPYGSSFLVFSAAREPRRVTRLRTEAFVEEATLEDLARAAPRVEVHAAPHVEVSVGSEKDAQPARLPLRVAARIATGGVDSWCFAELRFPWPLDLSSWRAIELSTRVPSAQEGPAARLLVILSEEGEDGARADYLADGRRGLGEAGLRRTAVAFESFRLAGWSRDADGKLDRGRIRAIRVGWGGYIGRAGERVAFDLEEVGALRERRDGEQNKEETRTKMR